jgi:hypothetical protein
VVRDQCPAITPDGYLGKDISEPFDKIIPVLLILENLLPLNASANNVVQGAGGVHTCFSWHDGYYTIPAPVSPTPAAPNGHNWSR